MMRQLSIMVLLCILFSCKNKINDGLYTYTGTPSSFNFKKTNALVFHRENTIIEKDITFIKVATKDSSIYVKIHKDCEIKFFENSNLYFERKRNNFYFENYFFQSTVISLTEFSGFYYYKIPIKKKSQLLVAFSSKNPDDVTFVSKRPESSELNIDNFDLPLIKIKTDSPITNDSKTKAAVLIDNNLFDVKIKIRGKTSQSFPKKQFSITFVSPNKYVSSKTEAVLNGTFSDRSLIRNAFAYELSSKIGLKAPKTSFYNVAINNIYEGVYLLMDKPIPSEKINLIKMDDKMTFETINRGVGDEGMKRIHYEVLCLTNDYSADKKIIDDLERLCSTNKIDSVIDISSFAKYCIINELTKNIDAYRKSIFLSHDLENKKLYAGPVWDYDLSLGLPNFNDGFNHEGFVYDYEPMKPWMAFWWNDLIKNPVFKKELVDKYNQLRKTELSNEAILSFVDSLYAVVQKDAELNFKRWNVLQAKDFWPNYYTPSSYEDEIEYIKTWLLKRLEWLDKQWLISPPQS